MSSILDDSYDLDPQHNQAAYNNLLPTLPSNEELLWSAQPVQGLLWSKGDSIFGCFGLGLTLFSFPLLSYLVFASTPWFIYFFLVPFLLLGLYLLVGHFLYNKWERSHTFYGLTSTTLWIKEGKKIKSISLSSDGHWQKYEQKNRHTWVLRAGKDQHTQILAVVGDIPLDSMLEQQLLALDQELMVRKKNI